MLPTLSSHRDRAVPFSRRQALQLAAGVSFTSFSGLLPKASSAAAGEVNQRVLRVAHLTDIHVKPETRAGEGMAACLEHINSMKDPPSLILNGGDHVMDSFRRNRDRTKVQWDLYRDVLKGANSIPVRSCLGNHDVWGWDRVKSETTGTEPGYGKRWACDSLGLDQSYYSFNQAGWHFIALDGIQPSNVPAKFSAFLDDAQFDWLSRDLASVPTNMPVLIWTHIPIISAVATLIGDREEARGHTLVDAGHVHADASKVLQLLEQYPNVRICLTGHLHRLEQIQFRGVSHYGAGAVCGKWWKGPNEGDPEGYAVIDLYADGSHNWSYQSYGWNAVSS